ncbi:hypothetical protein YC2023_050417 [Brassica napus]
MSNFFSTHKYFPSTQNLKQKRPTKNRYKSLLPLNEECIFENVLLVGVKMKSGTMKVVYGSHFEQRQQILLARYTFSKEAGLKTSDFVVDGADKHDLVSLRSDCQELSSLLSENWSFDVLWILFSIRSVILSLKNLSVLMVCCACNMATPLASNAFLPCMSPLNGVCT